MKILNTALASALVLATCSAHALAVDHVEVKAMLEKRFAIPHHEVGMATTLIPSKDCAIQIIDSASPLNDEATLQVKQGEAVVEFVVSNAMSYDWSRASFIDLTSDKRSGLNTFATVLKISETKLQVTHLPLYPNDPSSTEKSVKLTCHF